MVQACGCGGVPVAKPPDVGTRHAKGSPGCILVDFGVKSPSVFISNFDTV